MALSQVSWSGRWVCGLTQAVLTAGRCGKALASRVSPVVACKGAQCNRLHQEGWLRYGGGAGHQHRSGLPAVMARNDGCGTPLPLQPPKGPTPLQAAMAKDMLAVLEDTSLLNSCGKEQEALQQLASAQGLGGPPRARLWP